MKPQKEISLEERKSLLSRLCAELYDNNYDEMLLDMRERLQGKPMYQPLKSRLEQDVYLVEELKNQQKH